MPRRAENIRTGENNDIPMLGTAAQRVLDAAEELFMQKGYAAVTLRDIADALEIKQASLYYHFPDGKEQLYVAVATRAFERHGLGVQNAIASAQLNLQAQLQNVAQWFTAQPPMNFLGMMHADMPTLSASSRECLMQKVSATLFYPLMTLFADATARHEIRSIDPALMAGAFLSLLDGVRVGEKQQATITSAAMINELIDVLLNGMRPRQ